MVGKVDAHEHVKELHDRVASDPRVQVLKINIVLDQAKEAHERVKSFSYGMLELEGTRI